MGISSVATSSTTLGASVADDDADKEEMAVTSGSMSAGAKVIVDVEDIPTMISSNVSCLVVVASTSSTSCSTSVGAIPVGVSSIVFEATIMEDDVIFDRY